jgi:hypothetical protein
MNDWVKGFQTILFQNAINVELPAIFIKIVPMQHATFFLYNAMIVRLNFRLVVLRNVQNLMHYPKKKESYKSLTKYLMEQNLEKADIRHFEWVR